MNRLSTGDIVVSEVTVRAVRDKLERLRWERLMEAHHYLGFRRMFGGGLCHIAETPDGRWLVLLGWVCGSFKVRARDAWIGWQPEQQFRRLKWIANNTRFLILPGMSVPNLASRVLSRSLRRLSSDMERLRGHPVLLAETFGDPSRFRGTCYRAANWTEVGQTRGYGRSDGGWVRHGQSKRVWVRPLVRGAVEVLRSLEEPMSGLSGEASRVPPSATRLRSL